MMARAFRQLGFLSGAGVSLLPTSSCRLLPGSRLGLICVLTLCSAGFSTGCGEPGAPQPPSLNLPQPVRDLQASRVGDMVQLSWSWSGRNTDRTPSSGPVRIRICRIAGTGPCELVAEQPLAKGSGMSFKETLPTAILQDQPRLLTYYLELVNRVHQSAGRSNAAFAPGGDSVPALQVEQPLLRAQGVELRWSPAIWSTRANGERLLKIVRTLESAPARSKTPEAAGKLLAAPRKQPAEQTLEIALDERAPDPGRALDRTIATGATYQYTLQRVERLVLDGHAVEQAGAVSAPFSVTARDIFPPTVPQQLAAAADSSSQAIDLSWSPDNEVDLAGYFVYRREAKSSGTPTRVSGNDPLTGPSFHDATVTPGVAYAYSVSAVDASGNESSRSAESTETLASQPTQP